VVTGIRWLAVAAVVLVAAVATVAVVVLTSRAPTHEGGDPGGRMLAELALVANAVPADVRVISREYRDGSWAECDRAPGSGWTPPIVSVHFSTPLPPDQLVSRVGQQLTRAAWQLDHAGTSAWRPPRGAPDTYTEAIWRKRLADGATATAVLHSSDWWHDWWLYASAPPVGAEFPDNC
jgi:hypothetical protein